MSGKLDIDALKPLPPFLWQHTAHLAIYQQYFAFYNIDFSHEYHERLKHHFGVMSLASYDIAVHYFHLANHHKTVVLLHGYFDHVGLYGHLIKRLLHEGFNVLAYDLPGHGLSTGETAGIHSFDDYQAVLKALLHEAESHVQQPLYLVGQSTGGAIAMDYVMNNPAHPFRKMALLAPLVIPRRWLALKIILFTLGAFVKALPRTFERNTTDKKFLRFVRKKDPLQTRTAKRSWGIALFKWQKHFRQSPPSSIPLLVVQGEKDNTVDWRYDLEKIAEKFSHLKIKRFKNAKHHLANESPHYRDPVFDQIVAFLNSH